MPGLLSSMLMGPEQRLLRRPQASAQMAQQAGGGGLLSMINPNIGQNPLYQRFDQNRDTLANMFLGGVGAESPLERMRGMAGGAMQGRETSRLLQQERAKQEKEQATISRTMELLGKRNPELVPWLEAGAISPADAFNAAFKSDKPDLTDDLKEYQFARQQGYGGSFTDYMTEMRKAGATSVNVGGDSAPGLGKLSADYGYVLDPNTRQPVIDPKTGLPRAAAVPGSPAAQEAEQVAASSESKEDQQRTWNLIVNDEIGRALDIVEGDGRLPTTGFGSETMAGIGGTPARDLKGLLDTIKANAGFDRLQAMRDSSPTGGALGQVSERELAFLQSTIGNLEQSQSKDQVSYNLKRLKKIYQNMLDGKRAYDGLLSDNGASGDWQDVGNGVRIRKLD